MYQVSETEEFYIWRTRLRDQQAKAAIVRRLEQVQQGNLGDRKSLGGGLYEMRIHTGKGYRLYFVIRTQVLVILLQGGHKDSQQRDIKVARTLAGKLEIE